MGWFCASLGEGEILCLGWACAREMGARARGGEGGGGIAMMFLAACIITRCSAGVMVGGASGSHQAFKAKPDGTAG